MVNFVFSKYFLFPYLVCLCYSPQNSMTLEVLLIVRIRLIIESEFAFIKDVAQTLTIIYLYSQDLSVSQQQLQFMLKL